MKKLIHKLLREELKVSKYRQWSNKNHELANKSWATQAHLYDKYFLPIDTERGLENLKNTLLPKLDERGREAFITFYLYKKDVLAGTLGEGELK